MAKHLLLIIINEKTTDILLKIYILAARIDYYSFLDLYQHHIFLYHHVSVDTKFLIRLAFSGRLHMD